ncbi:MAG: acylphosphatase [Patescibacteria group bacterium]|jgi:acylphosphatase
MQKKQLTLKIHGLVQGVGFRYLSQKEAKKRGFTGYAINESDGTVKLVLEGAETDLKDFLNWCYNGVGTAQVSKIEQNWSDPTSQFSDFKIR